MNREEFNDMFTRALDNAIEQLAASPDVEVKKFYGMVYFFENLACFSPIFYGILNPDDHDEA